MRWKWWNPLQRQNEVRFSSKLSLSEMGIATSSLRTTISEDYLLRGREQQQKQLVTNYTVITGLPNVTESPIQLKRNSPRIIRRVCLCTIPRSFRVGLTRFTKSQCCWCTRGRDELEKRGEKERLSCHEKIKWFVLLLLLLLVSVLLCRGRPSTPELLQPFFSSSRFFFYA